MRRNAAIARGRRGGYLTPALAMALLTAFLVAAFVLNVGWRRAAEREIVVAADAAALAAAAELACDERLLDDALPQSAIDRIATRAEVLAARHAVVGVPASPAPGGIRIGRPVTHEDGRTRFLETDYEPTAVAVMVRRGTVGELPWLFRAGGRTASPLAAAAEAVIDGRVAALAPRTGGTVPVWPIALRSGAVAADAAASGSAAAPGWNDQVDLKLGQDKYGYDRDSGRVVERPDGLPELVATTLPRDGDADSVGLSLVDLGQSFGAADLDRVTKIGLAAEDLGLFGGTVPVAALPAFPVEADALPRLPLEVERNLQPGDARAVFLFENLTESGGSFGARLNGVVVARLMDLRPIGDGGWQATFQPAVLATGTAVLADAGDAETPWNRYLYKVRLSR